MELKVKKYIKEKHHRAFHLSLYFPTGDSPTSGIYFALPQRPIELGIKKKTGKSYNGEKMLKT
jgi:hypothetical protein